MHATQAKDIDGLTFSLTQLPPMKSLVMLNRLRRVVGPALGKLMGATGAKGLADLDIAKAGEALDALNLPDTELKGITNELLESAFVTVEGKTAPLMPQFDLVMIGRVGTIMKLLVFALEVNYGSFFVAVRALRPPPVTASPSKSG